jgi:hypothetical protein
VPGPEACRDRNGNSPRLHRGLGRTTQQRLVERVALRLRQLGCHLIRDRAEEIEEAGERNTRLGLGGSARKNAVRARLRGTNRLVPESGLTDTDVPFDEQGGKTGPRLVEERADRREFRIAPDRARLRDHYTRSWWPRAPRSSPSAYRRARHPPRASVPRPVGLPSVGETEEIARRIPQEEIAGR